MCTRSANQRYFSPIVITISRSFNSVVLRGIAKKTHFFVWIIAISMSAGFADAPTDTTLVVDNLVVTLVDQNRIPALTTGMIAELAVREGDTVKAGQLIGKLDDREAELKAAAAETELRIAQEKMDGDRSEPLAAKAVHEARTTAEEQRFLAQIAARKAENETRILAAKKSSAVAKNEWDRAKVARNRFVDSVSQSEIDGLRLAYERSTLEAQQAAFEQQYDRLQAKAEQLATVAHQSRVEKSIIELEHAKAARKIQPLQVQLFRQQLEMSKLATEQHQLRAPFVGVVAEVLKKRGDWVQTGDPIVRIIRLDRLSAEGFVSAAVAGRLRGRDHVDLIISTDDGNQVSIVGQIVFVASEVDPVNNEVGFRVEFDNPNQAVLPGMRLQMSVEL